MNCARVKAAVSGFEQEFGGRVKVRTIECDSPEGKEAVRRYDFQTHGMVIFDPEGQLIHKRRDHMASGEDARAVLRSVMRRRGWLPRADGGLTG